MPLYHRYGIRSFVARGMEVVICQSFAKNMGLYNERAGCVNLVTATPEVARAVESQLALIVRHMNTRSAIMCRTPTIEKLKTTFRTFWPEN